MSCFIKPEEVFNYFDNVVCPRKAKMLHSFCIAAILKQTSVYFEEHCQNFTCYCFKFRIHRLLGLTLLLRGFKNVYYFSDSNVNLVILTCWIKRLKKKAGNEQIAKDFVELTVNDKKHILDQVLPFSLPQSPVPSPPPPPHSLLAPPPSQQNVRRENLWDDQPTSSVNVRVC